MSGTAAIANGTGRAQRPAGFTLIELLVVIAIIGILCAVALPTLHTFKPDISAVAARQLLEDISHARHLAIAQRTTIYMVFCPTNVQQDPGYSSLTPNEKAKADKLLEKQGVAYAFVSLRNVGDQPGRSTPRYWGGWKSLPEGAFIPPQKFDPTAGDMFIYTNGTDLAFTIHPFPVTNNIPFPSDETATTPYKQVSYLAFNYLGQLLTNNVVAAEELIPISRGNAIAARDPNTKVVQPGIPPVFREAPVGNTTNSYNVVKIEGITGRAHIEKQEIQ